VGHALKVDRQLGEGMNEVKEKREGSVKSRPGGVLLDFPVIKHSVALHHRQCSLRPLVAQSSAWEIAANNRPVSPEHL